MIKKELKYHTESQEDTNKYCPLGPNLILEMPSDGGLLSSNSAGGEMKLIGGRTLGKNRSCGWHVSLEASKLFSNIFILTIPSNFNGT